MKKWIVVGLLIGAAPTHAAPFQLTAGGPADGSNGQAIAAPVGAMGIESRGNRLWIADTDRNKIRFIQDGVIITFAGNGIRSSAGVSDGTPALEAPLGGPQKVTVDVLSGDVFFVVNGAFYVVHDGKIYRIRPNGISYVSNLLAIPGVLLFIDSNKIWGCGLPWQEINWCVDPVRLAGTGSTSFNGDGLDAAATNIMPIDMAYESGGTVLVADGNNPTTSRIRRFELNRTMTVVKESLSTPRAVASAPNGDIYYAESAGNRNQVSKFSNGIITPVLGTGAVINVPQQWCMEPPCEGTSYPFTASDLTMDSNSLYATDQIAGLAKVNLGGAAGSTPTATLILPTHTPTRLPTCKATSTPQPNCE